jgi:hypothetical protein
VADIEERRNDGNAGQDVGMVTSESPFPLIAEEAAADYTERARLALHRAGCAGAMLQRLVCH